MICHSCNKPFSSFDELAKHIVSSKKGHRQGKKWAAKYLLIHNLSADKRRENSHRTPLTEQEKQNKQDLVRDLSGIQKTILTVCPYCKKSNEQSLPIEYIQSQDAWRTKSGCLIVSCLQHRHNERERETRWAVDNRVSVDDCQYSRMGLTTHSGRG